MYTNYITFIFSTLQELFMLKVTFSADGVIYMYFGEISLCHVNLRWLIAGFNSSQQITYVMTMEHNTELELQFNFALLSPAQVYQISLPAIFLNMLYMH